MTSTISEASAPVQQSVFLVHFTFSAPMDEVAKLLEAHSQHLDRHYADGVFLCSGSTVPFTGGVIIARGSSRGVVQAIVDADPFVTSGVATVDVIEFQPGLWSELPAMEALFGGRSHRAVDAFAAIDSSGPGHA